MVELNEMELERCVAGKEPRQSRPVAALILYTPTLARASAPRSAALAREDCPGGVCGVN